MNVKGSLENARQNEQRLRDAAWKCYSKLRDKSTNYAKRVLFLYAVHDDIVLRYERHVIEWDKQENTEEGGGGES